MSGLKNKTALVAGGAGLIGSVLVKGFRGIIKHVISADIRGDGLYFNMHPDYIESVDKILNTNIIDVFVNCTYPRDTTTAVDGWLKTTGMVAEHMKANGGGSIINFGSIYGMIGSDMALYEGTPMDMPTHYAFIKGGIIAASCDIATKYGQDGVRCNVVSPGGVWHHQPEVFVKRYEKRVPLGRMAKPEDILGVVLFLASDMSSYITGTNIPVDGGFTAL